MALTIQELRDYVRTYLDTDEEEVPDTLLAVWSADAQSRVLAALPSNYTLQSTWPLTTVADQQAYTYAEVVGVSGDIVAEILTVEGERWALQILGHAEAIAYFADYNGTLEPRHFSIYEEKLFLWPTPGDAYSLNVRGMRLPQVVTDAGTPPDCPDEMHPLIAEFMVGRAYQQFDDEIMSERKFATFNEGLGLMRKRWNRASRGGPRALGYTPNTMRPPLDVNGMWRNFYDWE